VSQSGPFPQPSHSSPPRHDQGAYSSIRILPTSSICQASARADSRIRLGVASCTTPNRYRGARPRPFGDRAVGTAHQWRGRAGIRTGRAPPAAAGGGWGTPAAGGPSWPFITVAPWQLCHTPTAGTPGGAPGGALLDVAGSALHHCPCGLRGRLWLPVGRLGSVVGQGMDLLCCTTRGPFFLFFSLSILPLAAVVV